MFYPAAVRSFAPDNTFPLIWYLSTEIWIWNVYAVL